MNELYKSCPPPASHSPICIVFPGVETKMARIFHFSINFDSYIIIARWSSLFHGLAVFPLTLWLIHFSSNFRIFYFEYFMNVSDFAPSVSRIKTSHPIMKALIFQNNEWQNDDRYHFEHIIWKILVFESRKPDRKSRIEGGREGKGTIMHLTKRRRLSFRMVLLIQKLWRVYQNDGFRPSFSPSSFFFLPLSFSVANFPSNERNDHATLTFHHLRHPRWHKVVEEDVSGFLARKDPLLLLSYRFCSFHRYRCKRLWVIRRIKPPRVLVFRTFSIHCALFTLTVVLAASDLLCRTTSANRM